MNTLSRREFLKMAGIGSAAAMSLAACGSSSSSSSTATEAEGTTSAAQETEASTEETATSTGTIEGVEIAEEAVERCTAALGNTGFTLAPFGNAAGGRDHILATMYATLFNSPYFGASLEELDPWIAKSITKVDDVTYDIELRDDVYDSQGNPITADDVVFSYETMNVDGEVTVIATDLESITKVDDYNVRMTLTSAGNGMIEGLVAGYRMAIINKDWYEGASDDDKMYNPATTGPYEMLDFASGAHVYLTAVEDYWCPKEDWPHAGKQNVKEIYYNIITESAMRSIALENHEADISSITATEVKRFADEDTLEPLDGYNVYLNYPTNTFSVFLFNMDEGMSPFADNIELRKAVLYALDAESLILASGSSLSSVHPCKTFGNPYMGGYLEEWEEEEDWYAYDIDKAKEHFANSGYKEGELTIRLLGRSSTDDAVHSVFLDAFDQLGIGVELMAYDQALFNNYKFDSTVWDCIIDNKSSNGHITQGWNDLWNPAGYSNGSAQFTHDDKLTELLEACFTKDDEDATREFHNYIKELALGKPYQYGTAGGYASQDGIVDIKITCSGNFCIQSCDFAADYVPV